MRRIIVLFSLVLGFAAPACSGCDDDNTSSAPSAGAPAPAPTPSAPQENQPRTNNLIPSPTAVGPGNFTTDGGNRYQPFPPPALRTLRPNFNIGLENTTDAGSNAQQQQ